MPNEIDTFFGSLKSDVDGQGQDVFDNNPQIPEKDKDGTPGGEGEGAEGRKNRRHRRLEAQRDAERQSNIALNERVKVLSEIVANGGHTQTVTTEMPAEWIALYGDTPEAKTAWGIQVKMFNAAKEDAKKEAIAEFQQQQQEVIAKKQEFEQFIESELEALEDEHDVDLTSDAPAARKARREFLELVQKVSPKDDAGNVTGYADFGSTFELYQANKPTTKTNATADRRKEIAANSMPNGNGAPAAQTQHTPGFRGWEKDYNLGQ